MEPNIPRPRPLSSWEAVGGSKPGRKARPNCTSFYAHCKELNLIGQSGNGAATVNKITTIHTVLFVYVCKHASK